MAAAGLVETRGLVQGLALLELQRHGQPVLHDDGSALAHHRVTDALGMRQAGCLRPGLELGGPATARRPGALVDKEARPVALRVVAAIRGYRVPAQLAVHGRLPVAALVTGRGDIEHREVLSLGLGPARRLGAL